MSLKTTIVLIVMAVVAGIVILVIKPFSSSTDAIPTAPWFYNVSMQDINKVDVEHEGQSRSFLRNDEGVWVFESPLGIPTDPSRWSGVTLLLSGPQSRRLLMESTNMPEQYGLDEPGTIVYVTLNNGATIGVRLGDKTVSEAENYTQVEGFPAVFLIDSTWGAVLGRLVTEPPLPSWYFTIDPENIVGIDLMQDDEKVSLKVSDDNWRFDDENKSAVDEERLTSSLPVIAQPSISIVEYTVDTPAMYGISDNSIQINLKHKTREEENLEYRETIGFTLGTLLPDGSGIYAQPENFNGIILIDAAWGKAIRGLLHDPPYASTAQVASSD